MSTALNNFFFHFLLPRYIRKDLPIEIFRFFNLLHFLSPRYLRKALSVPMTTPPLILKVSYSYTFLHFELFPHMFSQAKPYLNTIIPPTLAYCNKNLYYIFVRPLKRRSFIYNGLMIPIWWWTSLKFPITLPIGWKNRKILYNQQLGRSKEGPFYANDNQERRETIVS